MTNSPLAIEFRKTDYPELSQDDHADIERAIEEFNRGQIAVAKELVETARSRHPGLASLSDLYLRIRHVEDIQTCYNWFPGPSYLDWIQWFHEYYRPRTYIEIGVESGQSLQVCKPPTRAIGIDPEIAIVHPQEAWVRLYKLPSDDFFAQHDARALFDGQSVDLGFIDGLHTYDQALRDFMHIESCAAPGSIVLFHDIYPVIAETAKRERTTHFWLGDTWKVVPLLSKARPDLKVFTIPAFPSGLAVVANLNPASRELYDRHDELVEAWRAVDIDTEIAWMSEHLNVVDNDYRQVADLLALPSFS
jgi:hypothetical protein